MPTPSKPHPKIDPSTIGFKKEITFEATGKVKMVQHEGSLEEVGLAGSGALNLSHNHERGWPSAYRLKNGFRYKTTLRELRLPSAEIPLNSLPDDQKTRQGVVFFGPAREISGKDSFDRRRGVNGRVGVWTDGLMVTAPKDVLVAGKIYQVEVEEQSVDEPAQSVPARERQR